MPVCAIALCKNNTSRNKKDTGTTYHQFPVDPEISGRWTDIVRLSRQESWWQPKKRSIICSAHFNESDFYFTKRGLRKLSTGSIPQISLFLSSKPITHFPVGNTLSLEPSTSVVENSITVPVPAVLQQHVEIVKTLREKTRRLKNTNSSLKYIVKCLKRKRFIDNDINNILNKYVVAADSFNNTYKKNKKHKKILPKYTKEFKKFCLTLNFYSPSAYNYARDRFSTSLPEVKSLSNWYRSVNGAPGFTEETFALLKLKAAKENVICALIADEMPIRQQSIWDRTQNHGYVDIGTGTSDNSVLASEAYVFLLVSLTENWKLPLGYFLVHGLSGSQKSNLISLCLIKCHDVGVRIISVTFDGHPSNVSAMEILGCPIKGPKNLKTTFKHPISNEDVAIFLDTVQICKLIRNNFETMKMYIEDDGKNEINWNFLQKLHNLQDEECLLLANKTKKRYLEFRHNVMKVKLAPQLLSRSVAIALKFCREDLNLEEFKSSETTEKFILVWNNLFDIFNSNDFTKDGFNHPIFMGNRHNILGFLEHAKQYILNLNIKKSRKRSFIEQNQRVFKNVISFESALSTQEKTGFLGMLVCIESLKHVCNFLDKDVLKSIATYKTNQDYIELLFGAIRMHAGLNDSPNAKQFKDTYRKLLFHLELKSSDNGNCIQMENIAVLNCSSALTCINATTMSTRFEEGDSRLLSEVETVANEFDEVTEFLDKPCMSSYKNYIVGYISGFVVDILIKKLKCFNCIDNLTSNQPLWFHKFVTLQGKGVSFYASEDVYLICRISEAIIQNTNKFSNIKSNLICNKIVIDILKRFIGPGTSSRKYFDFDASHVNGAIHQVNLIQLIVEKYLKIRLQYLLV